MNLIVFHLKYTLEILFLLSPGKVRQILPETFMNCIFCSSLLTISIFTIPWTPDAAQPDLRPALILLEVSFLLTKVVWTGNGGLLSLSLLCSITISASPVMQETLFLLQMLVCLSSLILLVERPACLQLWKVTHSNVCAGATLPPTLFKQPQPGCKYCFHLIICQSELEECKIWLFFSAAVILLYSLVWGSRGRSYASVNAIDVIHRF